MHYQQQQPGRAKKREETIDLLSVFRSPGEHNFGFRF